MKITVDENLMKQGATDDLVELSWIKNLGMDNPDLEKIKLPKATTLCNLAQDPDLLKGYLFIRAVIGQHPLFLSNSTSSPSIVSCMTSYSRQSKSALTALLPKKTDLSGRKINTEDCAGAVLNCMEKNSFIWAKEEWQQHAVKCDNECGRNAQGRCTVCPTANYYCKKCFTEAHAAPAMRRHSLEDLEEKEMEQSHSVEVGEKRRREERAEDAGPTKRRRVEEERNSGNNNNNNNNNIRNNNNNNNNNTNNGRNNNNNNNNYINEVREIEQEDDDDNDIECIPCTSFIRNPRNEFCGRCGCNAGFHAQQ